MLFLKKYDGKRFAERYKRYRILFYVFLCLFIAGFFVRVFLFPRVYAENAENPGFSAGFCRLFLCDAAFYFVSFVFGVTIYSPFVSGILSASRGFFYGFVFSALYSDAISFQKTAFCTVYIIVSSLIFISYSSFCTLVSTRLFTDRLKWSVTDEEDRVFGGSLFNSTLFCNTVNLRFMCTYCVFFFAGLAISAVFALFHSLILTLL